MADKRFFAGKRKFNDPQTGREIWQMTQGQFTSYAPYMYRRGFSHDQRYIVYSSHRTGQDEVYRLEVETGEATQLTSNVGYYNQHLALGFDATGRDIYCIAGTTILAIDVDTGEPRIAGDYGHLTGGQNAGCLMPNGDGSQLIISYRKPNDRRGIALIDTGRGVSEQKPTEIRVFGEGEGVSHTLYCPTDNNLLTYAIDSKQTNQNDPTLSIELCGARNWQHDLRTGKTRPFLCAAKGFRITHDYWAPDGSKMYFHIKHVPNWVPASIGSVDRDAIPTNEGTEITTYYTTPEYWLGHSSVNPSQTKIVSDSQQPKVNPLILIDLKSGKGDILCWPNASGAKHPNHVHPAFSPDGRKILYTSDVTGFAQVYIVPNVA